METVILAVICLVSIICNICLFYRHKRDVKKIVFAFDSFKGQTNREKDSLIRDIMAANARIEEMKLKTDLRIKALEDGLCPDYEAQKKATSALNDFNQGLANILGFDPFEARKDARKKENGGTE